MLKRKREPLSRTGWYRIAGIAASVLTVVALAAGCSSAGSSTGTAGSASASASAGQVKITGPVAPGSDIGLTSSEIRVAMIADVSTPVAPGLFQKNVNVVKAWASLVNASGGLAGRKVVVDFCDAKYPAKAGAFDCNPANVATIKLNLAQ